MENRAKVIAMLLGLWMVGLAASQESRATAQSVVEKARQAAGEGKLAYKLTTPEELKELLGPPASEKTSRDGGMEALTLQYADLTARFTRMADFKAPFTLAMLSQNKGWLGGIIGPGGRIDIGQDRQVELRTEADLAKFDAWPLCGAIRPAISTIRTAIRPAGIPMGGPRCALRPAIAPPPATTARTSTPTMSRAA